MARKFLIAIAAVIFLIVAAGLAWSVYGERLMRFALVPGQPFEQQAPLPGNAYAAKGMWIARPDLPGNPSLWTPPGFKDAGPKGNAAIFFIHPTSYIDRSQWNAPLDDAAANDRAKLFVRGQASVFNHAGDIWVPRYRQATFGAFLTTQADAQRALDAAYSDILEAWNEFLREAGTERPIIIAGHSQGSVHLLRLLRERIAGQPVARRVVAAYVVGWPVSIDADLPKLGLTSCARADQANCIVSWQSFAEPADTSQIELVYDATTGFTGQSRGGTAMLCTNPVSGTPNTATPANANRGTIIPSNDLTTGVLRTGKVAARCNARGFLLIGSPPEGIGQYILPGNNYHVFDYSLFWANIRADAARRSAAFVAK